MSRAYQITVSESVRRHVRVSDGVRTHIELLDVLAAEAMRELLATELLGRGFQLDGNDMVRVEDDGVEIRIGVAVQDAGQVSVRLAREKEVDIEVKRSQRAYEETEKQTRAVLKRQVARAVRRKASDEEERLSAEVTETLERKLRDLRTELDRIGNRVTAEALKVRAGQLGEIREIREDPETGSLTIKVRV